MCFLRDTHLSEIWLPEDKVLGRLLKYIRTVLGRVLEKNMTWKSN